MNELLHINCRLISIFIAQLFALCKVFEAVGDHPPETLQLFTDPPKVISMVQYPDLKHPFMLGL
jgi:hypothetical protein